jgi:hypothetical protein
MSAKRENQRSEHNEANQRLPARSVKNVYT